MVTAASSAAPSIARGRYARAARASMSTVPAVSRSSRAPPAAAPSAAPRGLAFGKDLGYKQPTGRGIHQLAPIAPKLPETGDPGICRRHLDGNAQARIRQIAPAAIAHREPRHDKRRPARLGDRIGERGDLIGREAVLARGYRDGERHTTSVLTESVFWIVS